MFLGTQAQNYSDSAQKGRAIAPPLSRGERNGQAKLTLTKVKEIKSQLALGKATQAEIGCDFGVSREAISMIACGRNWNWVD